MSQTLSKPQKLVLYIMHTHGARLVWDYDQIGPRLIDTKDYQRRVLGKTANILIRAGYLNDGRDTAHGRAYEMTPSGYELAQTTTEADLE